MTNGVSHVAVCAICVCGVEAYTFVVAWPCQAQNGVEAVATTQTNNFLNMFFRP